MDLTLGYTLSGVPVTVTKASNPHIYVTGRSGSGKSYFLKGLLAQASCQGALCIVFDYTGDYQDHVPPDGASFRRIPVLNIGPALDPLHGQAGQSHELLAQQFLSLIHSVFRLGARMSLLLRRAVLAYLQEEQGTPSLRGLISHIMNDPICRKRTDTAIETLELMDSVLTCDTEPVCLDLTDPGIMVLDFAGLVDMQLRNLLLSMALNAIWNQRTMARSNGPPVILLLDEAQTLPWGNGSIVKRILCEGRKYGLAGWFAAQWISSKDAAAALEQAYLRVHFRPDEEDARRLAQRLSQESTYPLSQCVQLVRSLQVGQYLVRFPNGKLIKGCNFDRLEGGLNDVD